MAVARAVGNYIRISPRKVRLVVDLIRGADVGAALDTLKNLRKRAAGPVAKVLVSAIANAVSNREVNETDLVIEKIFVDEGPTMKRFMARAMGRATMIRKRSSRITIILDTRKEAGNK